SFRATEKEFESLQNRIATLGASGLQDRTAVVAAQFGMGTSGSDLSNHAALVVNSDYFQHQHVEDSGGRTLSAGSFNPASLTLLVPSRSRLQSRNIELEFRKWLEFQGELRVTEGHSRNRATIQTIEVAPGQQLFDYSTSADSSVLQSPVVAVLPAGISVLSDDWMASKISTAEVLFSDTAALREAIARAGLMDSISSVDSAQDLASMRLAVQERSLRNDTWAIALSILVAFMSAVVFGSAAVERNRRRDFVRRVHGIGLMQRMVAPAALAAVAGIMWLSDTTHVFTRLPSFGPFTVSLVVLDAVFMAGILAVLHARRDRGKS
ncbi:MAG: hypothetical protein JWP75_1574, partial [Frondihabitans sp.]|nr:hypothetical protein [Frondihabitans sp.]